MRDTPFYTHFSSKRHECTEKIRRNQDGEIFYLQMMLILLTASVEL